MDIPSPTPHVESPFLLPKYASAPTLPHSKYYNELAFRDDISASHSLSNYDIKWQKTKNRVTNEDTHHANDLTFKDFKISQSSMGIIPLLQRAITPPFKYTGYHIKQPETLSLNNFRFIYRDKNLIYLEDAKNLKVFNLETKDWLNSFSKQGSIDHFIRLPSGDYFMNYKELKNGIILDSDLKTQKLLLHPRTTFLIKRIQEKWIYITSNNHYILCWGEDGFIAMETLSGKICYDHMMDDPMERVEQVCALENSSNFIYLTTDTCYCLSINSWQANAVFTKDISSAAGLIQKNDNTLIAWTENRIWRMTSDKGIEIHSVKTSASSKLKQVLLSSDGSTLVGITSDTLQTFQVTSLSPQQSCSIPYTTCATPLPQSHEIALGTEAGEIKIISLDSGTCLHILHHQFSCEEAPSGYISSIYLSKDRKRLISLGSDKSLCFFNFETAKLIAQHTLPRTYGITQPNETQTLISWHGESIQTWDLQTGENEQQIKFIEASTNRNKRIKSIITTPHGLITLDRQNHIVGEPLMGFEYEKG